jgi:hypothetical protein
MKSYRLLKHVGHTVTSGLQPRVNNLPLTSGKTLAQTSRMQTACGCWKDKLCERTNLNTLNYYNSKNYNDFFISISKAFICDLFIDVVVCSY